VLALSIPIYLVIWLGIDLGILQEIVIRVVFFFLRITGAPVQRHGFSLVFEGFSFYISKDCTGWKGMLFLTALILATKTTWKKRAFGFALTLPIFFVFNLFRIILMVLLGIINRDLFYLLHDLVWQLSMIAVVVLLWGMWFKIKFK